jgi:ectoine hydroxylase-related dioxygenase (phytanoyl-CoA dioxygenase family)
MSNPLELDKHIEEYHTQGYTVFRGILPPSLVADLRRVTDRGRELAREKHGPQTQRFQPVSRFDLDLQPFHDFRDLPELREAVTRVLTPRHTYGDPDLMGVLVEPAEQPYCTRWHRDWRDNASYLDIAEWEAVFPDVGFFNQSNCALYEDHSLWVVPGSHLRPDLLREQSRFPDRPVPGPDLEGRSPVERERTCSEYVRSMPGAVQLHLEAGDHALYRNTLWHLGSYVPYCKRATLHDFVDTPEFRSWRERMAVDMERRKAEGHLPWEWSLNLPELPAHSTSDRALTS